MATTTHHTYERDCKKIHDLWERPGLLAQILASKSRIERGQIREKYLEMYGEDLINLLQLRRSGVGELSSACGALWLWMLEPIEGDAVVAREALDQQGETNYRALVEMFVGKKSSHVVMIKQAYQARFRRQLDQDIVSIEPSHPFKKILVALVASHKAHHADVCQHIAKCDARRLYQTGEGRSGAIDEAVVLEILSKRSIPQLKHTFCSYKHIYGHDYTKSLRNENNGEFEDALKLVVKCLYNPPKYYAKTLHESIKGMTIDKGALTRVMVGRCEVDMDEIQKAFKKKYKMELTEAICGTLPSGDCRDFLVALATKTTPLALHLPPPSS